MALDPLLLQNLTEMKDDIKDIKRDVSELKYFRSKVVGGSIAISAVLTLLIQLTEIYFRK
jgi:hypothetical protein